MPIASDCISTGHLPAPEQVRALVDEAHTRFGPCAEGRNADYIPALAAVPSHLFGICLAGTSGQMYAVGDTDHAFTIQSISKPFVFALICQSIGEDAARRKLGVNSTGLPFNSVIAVERSTGGVTNPMVNAGAIATSSLAPGAGAEDKWRFIRDGLSRFAGRALEIDAAVYASEMSANQRNAGIAKLLSAYDSIYFDPLEATDIYTRQCSLRVTARDLAVMAATLANGGVNPLTRESVIDPIHCQHVLAVMVTAGLYENSGDWLYDTGLPGKSGVSGGMIVVAPGKGGLATFAPPLDAAGNSVKGQLTARFLSERLGLNLFASRPSPPERPR
ncbi:glutaminase A [Thiocystis violascens]|uniref:Glutaminase n=1 Tax=Thiocystis violascens (strain ATCC 17096 / DSM 198 / 6111) TaxID=765911 RepID=I3Y8U3_THIV6|nr:glutaminase A [Thiocystis violascens]AFL73411.1 L-glutaminase [Thiocystis violascens DSM 198]